MSEQSVFSSRAVVYYFDSTKKTWAPSPVAGYTRLDIYKNMGNGACRVIGRGLEDPTQVVINSSLTKDTAYVRTRDQFHQFQDPRYLYGLSFGTPADAEAFAASFEKEVAALKGGGAPAPAPAAPAVSKPAGAVPKMAAVPAKPAAPAAPAAAKPAAPGGPPPPPAKGPPPPPKAPPKAAAPVHSGGGDDPPEGRNALLDSIQGFSKGKLKKADTVDKSVPVLAAAKPAASADAGSDSSASPARGGGGGASKAGPVGGGDMMGAILAKRAAMQKQNTNPSIATPAAHEPKKPAPPTAAKTGTLTRTESAGKPSAPTSKPKPPPARTNSAPSMDPGPDADSNPVSSSPRAVSNNGAELPAHLQILKDEILREVRAELASMKGEILNALHGR